jgi:anti-sigma factor RsiW
MISASCVKNQSYFSAYLDGAVSGKRMQEIARHLESCEDCKQEFSALRTMQQSLATLGSVKAPADLGLKLRLAISHQQAQ